MNPDLGALMTALENKGCRVTPDTLPEPWSLTVALGIGARRIAVNATGWRFWIEPDKDRRPHAADEEATAQEIFDALEGRGPR